MRWLLLILLLTACNPVDEYTVYIEPTFTPYEQNLILNAIATWNTGGPLQPIHLTPEFGDGDCFGFGRSKLEGGRRHSACVRTSTAAFLESHGFPKTILGGTEYGDYLDSSTCYMAMDKFDRDENGDIDPNEFLWSITHELGHSMAMEHTNVWLGLSTSDPRVMESLMRPTWILVRGDTPIPVSVSCYDWKQWDDLRGIETSWDCQ